jgi:cytochrome bd-type quinol oxidase subunit 1
MLVAKVGLIFGWILLGAWLFLLQKRRRTDPNWTAPYAVFMLLMLSLLACSVGTSSLLLYQDGVRGEA